MSEISVIVPVYRAENTIARCIDSILRQSFADFELILVDDCTPDNAGIICDRYAQADSRIRVIHMKQNQGVSAARNTGLNAASGRYVAFCDSDDTVAEAWLDKLYHATELHHSDFAICGFGTVYREQPDSLYSFRYADSEYSVIEGDEIQQFWRGFMRNENHLAMSCWNKLFRMDRIRQMSLFFDQNLSHSEDVLFVLSYACSAGLRAVVCNECLYYYTTGVEGSLTTKYKKDYWNTKLREVSKIRELCERGGFLLREDDPDLATYLVTLIVFAVNNAAASGLGSREQRKQIHQILRSAECSQAFACGQFVNIPAKYQIVLKTRSAFLAWLFLRLVQWKNDWKQPKA